MNVLAHLASCQVTGTSTIRYGLLCPCHRVDTTHLAEIASL